MQHRPPSGYDPHIHHSKPGQRIPDAIMSDPRRQNNMQPSGLPRNNADQDRDYDAPPPRSLQPPRHPPHQYPADDQHSPIHAHRHHNAPTHRYPPQHPHPPPAQPHPYRSYHPDPSQHQLPPDERPVRYAPTHSYDGYEPHSHTPQYSHPRQATHDYPASPYYTHAHPAHSFRPDDPAASHHRHGLTSPREPHRSQTHLPPPGDALDRGPAPHPDRYVSSASDHSRRRSASPGLDTRHLSDPHLRPTGSSRSLNAASSSAPSSAAPARAAGATRKRKKQFKYMLEHQAPDVSKPSGAAGTVHEDEYERASADVADPAEALTGGAQHKESRKKVKKACVFCKRSHMPCEEARPCRRCVKRGISHLCRDAEPAGAAGAASTSATTTSSSSASSVAATLSNSKRRFGETRNHALSRRGKPVGETESESDAESITSSAASSLRRGSEGGARLPLDMDVMPGASARDPDIRPTMSISGLLSPARMELQRRPKQEAAAGVSAKEQEEAWNRSMDASMQSKMKHMLEAGPAAADLSDIFGEMPTSLLMTPAMADLPRGQSLLRSSSVDLPDATGEAGARRKRSQSATLTTQRQSPCEVDEAGFKLPLRPKHLLQEEMATTSALQGGKPSYSYTFGYAKLARWMHTRYSRASCEQVDRSLSVIRPKLMALSRSLPEQELIGVEDSFYQLLEWYQANVLAAIPVAMIITRRTGEIYAANSHACKLFQLPESIFEAGQICHYQLVTEKDCVHMWEQYAREATRELASPPSQNVTLEIDRSLLLFDRPSFDPRTGEWLGDGSGKCPDGSPAVVRKKVVVTFEAKVSKHGLPFLVAGCVVPIPEA